MSRLLKKKPEDVAAKDLKVHHVAFAMLKDVEEKFPVDDIKLGDGTRVWNLIRIIIFYHFQKKADIPSDKKRTIVSMVHSIPSVMVEYLRPMRHPKGALFYGFSNTESRKLWNGKYYDMYMDPLADVLGDNLCVCEWPTEQGRRRKYRQEVYSKNYIPMHIPLTSKTFWNLVFYKLSRTSNQTIEHEEVLEKILEFISVNYPVDGKKLRSDIHDSIIIFSYIKDFVSGFLKKGNPQMVFIRCGYGRFPMALSQACKELGIRSVEVQHGFMNTLTPGYVKATKSENHDCVAEYFLAYGEKFAGIVKHGNLFAEKNVWSIGFPYLEKVKETESSPEQAVTDFKMNYTKKILVTSDSLTRIANAVETFVQQLASELSRQNSTVGIIFKPHPYDVKNYDHFKNYKNILVADKYTNTYDLFKLVNIHTTVFSTSAVEALSFGKPNILLNVGEGYAENIREIIDDQSTSLVSTVDQYIKKMDLILSDYDVFSKKAFERSEGYFKPHALENFKTFLCEQNMEVS
jgi:hypothetical protein